MKSPKGAKSYYWCYRIAETLNVVINGFRYDYGVGWVTLAIRNLSVRGHLRFLRLTTLLIKLMFIEFKNLNVAFGKEFPLAIVYLDKCDGERFLREQGIAKSGSFSSFIPLIAIVDNVPQKASCKIIFTNYRILNKEEEEDALDTLKRSNLTINDKGFISFLDYKQICFEVDGNILPYDDFCRYELPENQVFQTVSDNGYSYYGSHPF